MPDGSLAAVDHAPRLSDFSRRRLAVLIVILGGLSTVGPFATDLYLPALPTVARDLGATTQAIALTVTTFLAGLALGQLIAGPLSDTYGRRRVLLLGFALTLPWSLLLLPLIQTGNPVVYGFTIMGTYAIIGITMGPLAAFIPEIFATRYRWTGTGVSYNIGGIVGGAIPPVISPALLSCYGTWSIALLMAGLVVVSLVSVLLLSETAGRGLRSGAAAVAFIPVLRAPAAS